MNNIFNYKIEIDTNSALLKLNGELIFNVNPLRPGFFTEAYNIEEQLSGKKYSIKFFKHNVFYYKEEKIELYDEQKEILMRFDYHSTRYNLIFSRVSIEEKVKRISLVNTEKKIMVYKDEDEEVLGDYDFWIGTWIYEYRFSTSEKIKNPFHLFICCFCHKVLLRPTTR
ncbi:hypothetical protein HDF18_19985 [Mucilaginibacter sp. X5P1]|uniref:hypothetical protein n=1 Tax=Mucilaginibacter sp. X5P1 TaxID=2723088 RepID=UPI001614D5D7|nr:hypothetical protein [Mucilaginibacter sp. X5P1]MBB6139937.1 hypothetical protein [Mucilaginibacter sp. X5P1]